MWRSSLPSLAHHSLKAQLKLRTQRFVRIMSFVGLLWAANLMSAVPVKAAARACKPFYPNFTITGAPANGYEGDDPGVIAMRVGGLTPNSSYKFICYADTLFNTQTRNLSEVTKTTDAFGSVLAIFPFGKQCYESSGNTLPDTRHIFIEGGGGSCTGPSYVVETPLNNLVCDSSDISILYKNEKTGCLQLGDPITVDIKGLTTQNGSPANCAENGFNITSIRFKGLGDSRHTAKLSPACTYRRDYAVDTNGASAESNFVVTLTDWIGNPIPGCSKSIPIQAICSEEDRKRDPDAVAKVIPFNICDQVPPGSPAHTACVKCSGENADGTTEVKAVWTAVGCIKNNPTNIVLTTIKIGIMVAGGIALVMFFAASFVLATASGDAKRAEEAKEMFISAVSGLTFIILSVSTLQFVGVQIIQIPGFGRA